MNWYKKLASHWYFEHPDESSALKLPVVYIRFGDLPRDAKGNLTPSLNHLRGRNEKGISVYPAYYDKARDMYILASGNEVYLSTQQEIAGRPAYLVQGQEIDVGYDDGEPVLDPKTVKVIKPLDPSRIVFEQDRFLAVDGTEYSDDNIPGYATDDVSAFPDNKPLWTLEQKAEHQRKMDEQHRMEMEAYKQRRVQEVEAVRQLINKYPEYAARFQEQYPELRNSSV